MSKLAAPDAVAGSTTRKQRLLVAGSLLLLLPSLFFIWRHFQSYGIAYETGEKRPLLKSEGADFHDAQTGIRFTPPPKWSMQARSYEAPDVQRKDRLVVKFKRVLPNAPAAWLRVEIADVPAAIDIVDAVKQRKAGSDWKTKGAVEPMNVAGLAAARIQHGGMYNGIPSLRDIVGVRRGPEVIYFIGTYGVGDRQAQEQLRQAIQTSLFDPR